MQSKPNHNRINNVIETTLKNLSNVIDVDTVIGKPITSKDGTTIIPVSKITVGVISGGGEYGKINIFKKGEDLPYSAGNGAIVSVKPCGFLVNDGAGYKMISIADSPYEKLLDKTTDFIEKLNNKN